MNYTKKELIQIWKEEKEEYRKFSESVYKKFVQHWKKENYANWSDGTLFDNEQFEKDKMIFIQNKYPRVILKMNLMKRDIKKAFDDIQIQTRIDNL